MKRKMFTPEQIIGKLREAEVLLSQGRTVGAVSRKLEVTEQTYYRYHITIQDAGSLSRITVSASMRSTSKGFSPPSRGCMAGVNMKGPAWALPSVGR